MQMMSGNAPYNSYKFTDCECLEENSRWQDGYIIQVLHQPMCHQHPVVISSIILGR